jgi:hypothetical protein
MQEVASIQCWCLVPGHTTVQLHQWRADPVSAATLLDSWLLCPRLEFVTVKYLTV